MERDDYHRPVMVDEVVEQRVEAVDRPRIEHDDDVPLKQYDKILFHPKNAIPVDFEVDNQLFVVPVDDVVAVFRRDPPGHGEAD